MKFTLFKFSVWGVACCWLSTANPVAGAESPTTPEKIWLNLGYSTLDQRPPDWDWVREQCRGGRLLSTLDSVRDRIGGLVIPIFDDGRCFYETSISLFQAHNATVSEDETALRNLLAAARNKGIPVYLGVDALGWQKDRENKQGVLNQRPDLREADYGGGEVSAPSPFHPEVRRTLRDLAQELATRFPEAAGLALDLRMSERSLDGFSDSARSQFILRHGLDPLDFRLDNIAGLSLNDTLRAWVDWKRASIAALVTEISRSYKSHRDEGRVLVSGYADYYTDQEFHDVRTAQDWLGWAAIGSVDGILLEGRWLAPFQDIDRFQGLQTRWGDLGKRKQKDNHPPLVPVSAGAHLIQTSNYDAEWSVLQGRNRNLESLALLVRDDEDLNQALLFARGEILPKRKPPLQVGAPLPDFVLPSTSGVGLGEWSSKTPRGKQNIDLYLVRDEDLLTPLITALSGADGTVSGTTERVIVSSVPGMPQGIPAGTIHLRDDGRELLDRAKAGLTRLVIDRAGYVRGLEALSGEAAALREAVKQTRPDPTPHLLEGSPAPDFTAVDAAGQEIRLADYRGNKHVLITFFPKCFTDG